MPAARVVRRLVVDGLRCCETQLSRSRSDYLLLPAPGHRAGSASLPFQGLCRSLAAEFPCWSTRQGS